MVDYIEFVRNVNAFPTAKLLQYTGKYVAWSEDGTTIVAAADDIPELIAAVDAQYPVGYEFTIDYVPAGWDGKHDPPPSSGTPLGRAQIGTAP